MHENREISGASRSPQDRDRSAKALSHKAGMHVSEKSDRATVPMNQPNKGEQSSAEVGEGRAQNGQEADGGETACYKSRTRPPEAPPVSASGGVAYEGSSGLLPIPCCSRKSEPASCLPASTVQVVASRVKSAQPARSEAVEAVNS